MVVSEEHIEYLANLAHLGLTEKEKSKYAEQISSILDYFKKLEELDTNGVEPLAHVFDLKNVVREDKVKQIFSEEKVLAEVPEIEKKQIKVKSVLGRDT